MSSTWRLVGTISLAAVLFGSCRGGRLEVFFRDSPVLLMADVRGGYVSASGRDYVLVQARKKSLKSFFMTDTSSRFMLVLRLPTGTDVHHILPDGEPEGFAFLYGMRPIWSRRVISGTLERTATGGWMELNGELQLEERVDEGGASQYARKGGEIIVKHIKLPLDRELRNRMFPATLTRTEPGLKVWEQDLGGTKEEAR